MDMEDWKGVEAAAEDLALINRLSKTELGAEQVYVFTVRLCDNEVDRDGERFSVPALEKLAQLFVGRTGIFDHDPKGKNQTARIYRCQVERQEGKQTAAGEPYHCLRASAYLLRTAGNQDLIREIDLPLRTDFMAVSSYGSATKSSGAVQITHDIQQDITGRHLVVIEDILDSGNTLAFLKQYFLTKGAASVTICTLLDKPSRRTKAVHADYVGFEVPDEFVVGYGLDYAQLYRNIPYIGVLKPEVYAGK